MARPHRVRRRGIRSAPGSTERISAHLPPLGGKMDPGECGEKRLARASRKLMNQIIRPARGLSGSVAVPADKSIAHRAAIFAAISTGTTRLAGYPRGADTLSTVRCLGQLGVESHWEDETLVIQGCGLYGLSRPDTPLDCGNSGTSIRLLMGLLAAQSFDSELTGDDSLLKRPMERVAGPLREMGASISMKDGKAPIQIEGNGPLSPIDHTLAVPSAQVKTAIVLASLTATEASIIREPSPSRDHTERMLGLEIAEEAAMRTIKVLPRETIEAVDFTIPGDFSSAAFFIVGSTILPESDLTITGVGANPTRAGLLEVLESAGASIDCYGQSGGVEPRADIRIRSAQLKPFEISGAVVPRLVDEIPVLAVAATQASGESVFSGIGELRAKESDRIATTTDALSRLGGNITAGPDSMTVRGATLLSGSEVDSDGDHRIAMAMAIAGLIANGETTILRADSASVSYPGFWADLASVSQR
jgi:3-phosphoshikimate 1-carboxyvinyltransferase